MRARLLDSAFTLVTAIMVAVAVWLAVSRRLPNALDSLVVALTPGLEQPTHASDNGESGALALRGTVDFARSRRTLLVVVRSDCRFCTASKALYSELLKRERAMPDSVRVFLVGPPTDIGFPDYMTDIGFAPHRRVQISGDDLRVVGTPTLLLVDHRGRIENTWLGKLASDEEAAVLDTIFGVSN